MQMKSTLECARWITAAEVAPEGLCFMHDSEDLPASLANICVVVADGTEEYASMLLDCGAAMVVLGDLALLDSLAVERLVQKHGGERIGVWLRAVKKHVTWSIDYISNEDFNCLTPSVGAPGWELSWNDGSLTGTDAQWWLGKMLSLGASKALISMDMQDDDLNICAGLIEDHGDKLWFSPWQQPDADIEPWVRYGQVRQLALPANDQRDEVEMARISASAMVAVADEVEEVEVG
jgi:hypothetical protein